MLEQTAKELAYQSARRKELGAPLRYKVRASRNRSWRFRHGKTHHCQYGVLRLRPSS